jgi:hypothetical protein
MLKSPINYRTGVSISASDDMANISALRTSRALSTKRLRAPEPLTLPMTVQAGQGGEQEDEERETAGQLLSHRQAPLHGGS